MILFQEDFDRYPSWVIDEQSPNKSFLDYALLLKHMGVKNWKWPIVLLHPQLLGKNPRDPSLSMTDRVLFAREFKLNPWSYFRMAAWAPGATYDNPNYYLANRSNMAFFWLYFNHITTTLTQPRQTGKTHGISQLDNYLNNIRNHGSRTLLMTKDEGLRATTLAELKSLEELLPDYLRMRTKMDVGNREELNISALDNNYKSLICRNDPIAADKGGRGLKIGNLRFDEAAYLPYIETVIKVVFATTTAARVLAEQRGNTYGNILASTAGKRDDRDGGYMYNYVHDSAPWSEFYFDAKNLEELRALIKAASRSGDVLRVNCTFNHRQLGYTDEWLRSVLMENNASGEVAERDYLNIWTSGSQSSPFTPQEASIIRESQQEPSFGDISKHSSIFTRWFIPESILTQRMSSDYTLLTVDTSDGQGNDDIAVNIKSLRTGEVLGAATLNEINLITVANYLADLLIEHRQMTLVIERRNQAATIVDMIVQRLVAAGINPFRRIFNMIVQQADEYPHRMENLTAFGERPTLADCALMKRFMGFATSGGSGITSRSGLFGTTMRSAFKYTGTQIRDKVTIDQLLSLVIKNGQVNHPAGGHDDAVVAWLLGHWFIQFGKNLQYYGIPPGYVLSANVVAHSVETKEEAYRTEVNRRTKLYIQNLIDKAKEERDPYVTEKIAQMVRQAVEMLDDKEKATISLDEFEKSIKQTNQMSYVNKRSLFA